MKKDIKPYPFYEEYQLRIDAVDISRFVEDLLVYLDTGLFPPVEVTEGDPQTINHGLYCVGKNRWAYRATVIDRLDRQAPADNYVLLEITPKTRDYYNAAEFKLKIIPSTSFAHRLDQETIDNLIANRLQQAEQPIPVQLPLEKMARAYV